jgi:choline transporter-like protein 2/4/5
MNVPSGFIQGNPQRLVYPVDSNGRLCGLDPAVADKPFLLFFNWIDCIKIVGFNDLVTGNVDASTLFTCSTQQVCVSACPTANEVGVRADPVCVDGIDTAQFDVLGNASLSDGPRAAAAAAILVQLIFEEKCAPYYISSESLANRCIPTFAQLDLNITLDNVTNFNVSDVPNLKDLIFNVNLNDILSGTLTQAIFLNIQAFIYGVLQDLQVVWPAILM